MPTLNQLLVDHFRCLEGAVEFEWPSAEESHSGYFRLGDDVVCYTQSSTLPLARTACEPLHDALSEVRFESLRCVLPFDPVRLVENLRRERYVRSSYGTRGNGLQKLIREAYYGTRPFLPVPVRRHLQRLLLAGRTGLRFPHWPVDSNADRLLEKLLAFSVRAQGQERLPFIWFWPDGHSSVAIMTHDVETSAGLQGCSALMDLDEEYGIPSSFQLIPEGRYKTPLSLLNEMRRRGFEINIHDLNHDGRLYWEREEFLRRAARINHYSREFGAKGFRAGVLYRNPDWYDAFDFSYDMSVPNVGHLGPQAGGCCTVMPYFVGGILELPVTTTEDYSLFQILGEYSIDLWSQQIELIQNGHGLVSFIIHPDYLTERRALATYRALLEHLMQLRFESGLWFASPGDVNEWWRARSRMTLVRNNGAWQIEGAGSEHARVAYASLDGDSLRYTLEDGSTTRAQSRSTIHSAEALKATPEMDERPFVPEGVPASASNPVTQLKQESPSASLGNGEFGPNIWFGFLCFVSAVALWEPLRSLISLAYHSDYYTHTVIIPVLAGYLVFLERKTIFADSKASLRLGFPLMFAGTLIFALQRLGLPWIGPAGTLSLAIFSLVLFWIGGFALFYGGRAFRTALFPLLMLLLMVPLPMALMNAFIHVTRIGSAAVVSLLFGVFGIPAFREGFLFILPSFSIEIAKECSGIHSTIALFVLALMAGYLFLHSAWKRVFLVVAVFPIVSLTNGLRIATLTLLAEYVDRHIFNTRLHRDGGILFFLLAFGLIAVVLRLLSKPHARKRWLISAVLRARHP